VVILTQEDLQVHKLLDHSPELVQVLELLYHTVLLKELKFFTILEHNLEQF